MVDCGAFIGEKVFKEILLCKMFDSSGVGMLCNGKSGHCLLEFGKQSNFYTHKSSCKTQTYNFIRQQLPYLVLIQKLRANSCPLK